MLALIPRFCGIDPADGSTQLQRWLPDYVPVYHHYLGVLRAWLEGDFTDVRLLTTAKTVTREMLAASARVYGRIHRPYPLDQEVAATVLGAILERIPETTVQHDDSRSDEDIVELMTAAHSSMVMARSGQFLAPCRAESANSSGTTPSPTTWLYPSSSSVKTSGAVMKHKPWPVHAVGSMDTFMSFVPSEDQGQRVSPGSPWPLHPRGSARLDRVVRDALVPLLVHGVHLQPGEVRAQAVVNAETEAGVRVVTAVEVYAQLGFE